MNQTEPDALWLSFKRRYIQNKGLTKLRIDKLLQMYGTCNRGIGKPLDQANREDIERFVDALHEDRFVQVDGDPYSGSSKSDIKKFLKQFYKWLRGDGEFFPPEVRWIKTNIGKDEKPKEKPVINKEEALLLAKRFTKTQYRILTLLLFDSGFRISEMMSVKKRNITFDAYDDQHNKCFWVTCTESKTELRTIPVPLFTKELSDYFNSTAYNTLDDDAELFNISYECFNKMLKRYSVELFNKKVSPHALRHSSATLYSRLLDGNMNEIAQRYGWSLASQELKTYIRNSGAYQKSTAKKVYSNEVLKLRDENVSMREELDAIKKALVKREAVDVPFIEIVTQIIKEHPELRKKVADKLRMGWNGL
ncbi:MAG: tyrosine-type recombinase/integrase [Nanoarchaeota archaeon]